MKVWIFSLCRNEAEILPFYLRHYAAFSERILVWDDQSDDGSRQLLDAHPNVTMNDWPYPGSGIDEELFLKFAIETYPMARGLADWVIWVDCDEFVYHPRILDVLGEAKRAGSELVATNGYNMVGTNGTFPADDGRQIWEIAPMGVRASVYSKPTIFRPEAKMSWNRGKHALENCTPIVYPKEELKLLHYRYMGESYTRFKNAKNYDRCGLKNGDKGAAWSCAPTWEGPHSPKYAEEIIKLATNVI